MPNIIEKIRRQKAIYWAPASNDGYGNKTFSAPIEIDCRFEDVTNVITDATGRERVSNSLAYVDRELETEGYLKKGRLTDLDSSDSDPREIDKAHEIVRFDELPDFRNRKVLLTAYM